jgi:hypothetical protein
MRQPSVRQELNAEVERIIGALEPAMTDARDAARPFLANDHRFAT